MSLDYSISSESSTESIVDSNTETYEIGPRPSIPVQSQSQPHNRADDTEDDIDENVVETKKGRGKNKVYDMIPGQITLKEAIEFVQTYDSTKWTRAYTRKTQEGEKHFYTCQKGCPISGLPRF